MDPKDSNGSNDSDDHKPSGAIFITMLLAGLILVTWFSMYALNVARS